MKLSLVACFFCKFKDSLRKIDEDYRCYQYERLPNEVIIGEKRCNKLKKI